MITKSKITKVVTNWRFNPPFDGYDGRVESDDYELGVNDVVHISQNEPQGGREIWNFVVMYKDGTGKRLFNVNEVFYANS